MTSDQKSSVPIIAGRYPDTGDGFARDGKYLGQFSLTSVLQTESPRPATNNDVVVVVGHLPDPAETRKAGPAAGPSDDVSPHRESAWVITQGHGCELDCRPGSSRLGARIACGGWAAMAG